MYTFGHVRESKEVLKGLLTSSLLTSNFNTSNFRSKKLEVRSRKLEGGSPK